jgi:hypothetical protein
MCGCLGDFAVRICFAIVVLAALSVLDDRTVVQAQSYGSGSSSGGTSSYGGAPTTSGRQGMFGNRSVGSGLRSGQGAFGSGSTLGPQGDLSSARFVRGNRQPGDFVGGNSQDGRPFVGGAPADTNFGNWPSSAGPMSSWTPGGGYPNSRQNPNRNQPGKGETAGQNATSIHTTFHAAFEYPQPNSNQLSTSLTQRLAKTPAIQTQTPIRVELQGCTAILRGVASTEHDRALAEQMIRLEAGIEAVRNEIAVANPTPAASPSP